MSYNFKKYDVQCLETSFPNINGPVWHIKVWRRDGKSGIPWDDLQAIKNSMVSSEAWAIEVYPPQSEVVDELNMRHLWVMPTDHPLPNLRRSP